LGGDEFVVLFINTTAQEAKQRIEEMIRRIRSTQIRFQNETLPRVHLSAGLATAPEHATAASELKRAADDALYVAKNSGKNRIQVYSPQSEP
ncbi:GGDEF domain-containing protein, partial [Alicyclobacillus cellulosilyticus]